MVESLIADRRSEQGAERKEALPVLLDCLPRRVRHDAFIHP